MTARSSRLQKRAILLLISWERKRSVRHRQDIRLDSDGEQFFDRVLRRLGLQLLRGADPRHQRNVYEDRILPAILLPHLPDRFQKGKRFDIAHRSPDLDDRHIVVGGHFAHRVLDFVGHVGNDLHRLAKIIAAAFLGDDLLVDSAGG